MNYRPRQEVLQLTPQPLILGFHRDDILAGAFFAMTLGERLKSAMPNLVLGLVVWAASSAAIVWLLMQLRESFPPRFMPHLIEWAQAPRVYRVDMEPRSVPLHL